MVHIHTAQVTLAGDFQTLNDLPKMHVLLDAIIMATGLTLLTSTDHVFQPQGVSIVKLLAESHIALHTWPEDGTGYVTLTTCSSDAFDTNQLTKVVQSQGLEVVKIDNVIGSTR